MKLQQFQLTHVGLTRQENQDSVFSQPEEGIFLVADGMGGEKAGAEASAQVVATIRELLAGYAARLDSPDAVGFAAAEALQTANKDVYEISVREPDKSGLGSTGSLLLFHKGLYFVAQVGDSRIYQVRGGNCRMLTRDHSIVWELYENGIINRDQMETHPERHLLTQCIGGSKPVQVDLFSGRIEPGDLYLICSDGLTSYAGEAEVMRLLIDPVYSLEERAYRLLQAALEGGGGDNVSVVLVQVDSVDPEDDWEPAAPPAPQPRARKEHTTTIRLFRPRVDAAGGPLPSRKTPPAILAGVGLIAFGVVALLLALVFGGRKGVDLELAIAGLTEDAGQCVFRATDGSGASVILAAETAESGNPVLRLPRAEPYRLEIACPMALETARDVDLTQPVEAPVQVVLEPAGAIVLEGEIALVARMKVVNEDVGETVYEVEAGGEPRRGGTSSHPHVVEHEAAEGAPARRVLYVAPGLHRLEVSSAEGSFLVDGERAKIEPGQSRVFTIAKP